MANVKLSAAVRLACRDTALTKGSALRNMFVMRDDTGGDPMVEKRPALHTSQRASTNTTQGNIHGCYYRKNAHPYLFPPDENNLNTNNAKDVLTNNIVVDSNSKGQFVMGASGTTTGVIAYSLNNNINNWIIAQELDSADYAKDFTYDYDNDLWLCITFGGKIWTASGSDLSSWTDRGTQFSTAGYGIAYLAGTTEKYVAVGDDATGDIQSSSDGITWTDRDNTDAFYCVAASGSGGSYVAGGNGGIIYTSTDGITWTSRTNPVGTSDVNKILYNEYPGRWVLCMDGGHMAYSALATSQPTSFTANSNEFNGNIVSITCGYNDNNTGVSGQLNAPWVACSALAQQIKYSEDGGATWTDAEWPIEGSKPSGIDWYYVHRCAIMYHPDSTGTYDHTPIALGYIAYASDDQSIATSPDGRQWFYHGNYRQVYFAEGSSMITAPLEDLTAATYSRTVSTENEPNTVQTYTKAYWAESTLNDTPVIMALYPAVGPSDTIGGTMLLGWGNSSMQPFHGGGGGDATSVLEYPFSKTGSQIGLAHGIVAMDGYFFMMNTKGDIYHSTLNKPEAWPALNKIQAQLEGDAGVAIAKHHNNILAFGEYTTEVFYNGANPVGSVLNRREDIRFEIGMAAPNTMGTARDVTIFVGQDRHGDKGVYMINRFRLSKISDQYIDRWLKDYQDWTQPEKLMATMVEYEGHNFYVMTGNDSNNNPMTVVYHGDTNSWEHWYVQDRQEQYTWYNASSATSDFMDAIGFFISEDNEYYMLMSEGDLYKFDKSAYQDYGTTAIECQVQYPIFESKQMITQSRARHRFIDYVGDVASSTENITLDYSDDDYQTFVGTTTIDISLDMPRTHNLGAPRRRAYRVTHTANSDFRMNGLELELQGRMR